MDQKRYRIVKRPQGVEHRHPFLVFDCQERLHLPLTVFGKAATERLDVKTVQTYLYAVWPFFTFLEADPWQVRAERQWTSPPEQIRQSIDDYLVQRLQCLVQPHTHGFHLVSLTAGTKSTLRVFLSGLKLFYRIAQEQGVYPFPNPLVDPFSVTLAEVTTQLEQEDGTPRMPEVSGVEAPRRKQRLTDSYYKLVGEEWVPQVVDGLAFRQQVLDGGRSLPRWNLRSECVTRLLFESGARVSEVVGLTLGGWAARGYQREARAFNKGSHGRLTKTLRFWPDTVKLLQRYFDEERCKLDPQGYTLADYRHLAEQRRIDLLTIPLFLSDQRTPLSAKTYREHAWNPACQAAHMDADVHQARHWFVTMMVREIYLQAKNAAQVQADRQGLIHYMRWKSGEETLAAYDHYFDRLRQAELQDGLVTKLEQELSALLTAQQSTFAGQATQAPRSQSNLASAASQVAEDFDFLFLRQLGGEQDAE